MGNMVVRGASSVKCGYAQVALLQILLPLSRHEPRASWLYDFNPFPLRDFPYLVSLAGAEKVTLRLILCLYRGTSRERRGSTTCVGRKGNSSANPLPLSRHESRASRLYEMSYCHWRNVVTVIQCRRAEKVTLRLVCAENVTLHLAFAYVIH